MYLAKIKDSFMFGGKEDNSHWWLIGKDKFKRIYALETTHLYKPDSKRMNQVQYGILRKVKFSCFETPSGVNKKKIFKSHDGKFLTNNTICSNSYDIKKKISIKKP